MKTYFVKNLLRIFFTEIKKYLKTSCWKVLYNGGYIQNKVVSFTTKKLKFFFLAEEDDIKREYHTTPLFK